MCWSEPTLFSYIFVSFVCVLLTQSICVPKPVLWLYCSFCQECPAFSPWLCSTLLPSLLQTKKHSLLNSQLLILPILNTLPTGKYSYTHKRRKMTPSHPHWLLLHLVLLLYYYILNYLLTVSLPNGIINFMLLLFTPVISGFSTSSNL